MADKLKDELDVQLEAMFRSEPIRDDGFSVRVVSKVRRRLWVRRLSLPIAFVLALVIGAKPLLQLVDLVPALLQSVPLEGIVGDNLPLVSGLQMPSVLMGAALLGAVMMVGRILEDT